MSFTMKIEGVKVSITRTTSERVATWFWSQERVRASCEKVAFFMTERGRAFAEAIKTQFEAVQYDTVLAGITPKGDVLYAVLNEKEGANDGFYGTISSKFVSASCEACQVNAAMDRINVVGKVGSA